MRVLFGICDFVGRIPFYLSWPFMWAWFWIVTIPLAILQRKRETRRELFSHVRGSSYYKEDV